MFYHYSYCRTEEFDLKDAATNKRRQPQAKSA